MNLPNAPKEYSQADQSATRREIEHNDRDNLKANKDLTFVLANVTFRENKLIITSTPGKVEYYIVCDDAGVLSTVAR